MIISLIAAMDPKRGIGYMNDMAWRGKVPADMKHFRELTIGHPVVMGRKTYESMGRALPNRRNVVISRTTYLTAPDIEVFASPSDALAALNADNVDEVFVIGGALIFTELLPKADRLHITYIEGEFPADTYFPEIDETDWHVTCEEMHPADKKNLFPLRFVTHEKNPAS